MKSHAQLYLVNLAFLLVLAVCIGAVAMVAAIAGFDQPFLRAVPIGGAIGVAVVFLIYDPLRRAWAHREILEYQNERMDLSSDIHALREQLEKERHAAREFRQWFAVSQKQADEVLTEAARVAYEACVDLRKLFLSGAEGNFPLSDNPGRDMLQVKAAFEGQRSLQMKVMAAAIRHFGRLWDLAADGGYTLKKCWPEYLGLSSEDPTTKPPEPDPDDAAAQGASGSSVAPSVEGRNEPPGQ